MGFEMQMRFRIAQKRKFLLVALVVLLAAATIVAYLVGWLIIANGLGIAATVTANEAGAVKATYSMWQLLFCFGCCLCLIALMVSPQWFRLRASAAIIMLWCAFSWIGVILMQNAAAGTFVEVMRTSKDNRAIVDAAAAELSSAGFKVFGPIQVDAFNFALFIVPDSAASILKARALVTQSETWNGSQERSTTSR